MSGLEAGPPADAAGPAKPPSPLARNTFLALQADVATALSAFGLAIVIARGLGPTNRGIYFLALFAATLIALIGNMGMATAAIVFGANRRVPLGQMHGMAIMFSVGVGAAGAILLLGLESVWVGSVLGGVDHATMILVAASVAPLIYGQILGALVTGMGHVAAISTMRIALAVATPVVTVPAVVLGDGEPFWPVAAWLAATSAFAVAVGRHALRHLAVPARPSRAAVREIVSFALRGHIGTLSHQGFLRIDALFVSAQLGPTAVGLYAQASVLAERMSTLGHAVYSSSAARLGSDPRAEAAALTAELVRMLLIVTVPIAVVLAIFSHTIMVVLFGSDFGPAATPFAILLPGAIGLTLWYVVSLYVVSTLRRPGTTTIIQSLAFVVSVPLYWLAVERWGINGAAVVSTVTYLAVFGAGVALLLRTSQVRWAHLRPTGRDVRRMAGLAAAGVGAALRRPARSR